jgi:hypothetical protein
MTSSLSAFRITSGSREANACQTAVAASLVDWVMLVLLCSDRGSWSQSSMLAEIGPHQQAAENLSTSFRVRAT